jgi:Na+/H+-translocating membrane pyrophosphatase
MLRTDLLYELLRGRSIVKTLGILKKIIRGAAWDNAKKYIEEGHHGGKKSL